MNLSGNPLDYIAVFLGGVVLSFTPCVYPLIPISASYIGITAGSSKIKGLFLSLIYVSGLAVTYSFLGLFASLSGEVFGAVSSYPIVHIIVGVIIIFFGLSMLDIFHLPSLKMIKAPALKKQSYFSAFFLGLTSGWVISPCTTPALGAILVYLAAKKNILYGATLLFTFACGLGMLLIIAGTFSSVLISLPKSGKWMLYVKRLCAFILIAMGIYFIYAAIRRL
jgi:thiol:disulfide interchange protein DsbD